MVGEIAARLNAKLGDLPDCVVVVASYRHLAQFFISPKHKRTEGRAPVWGSEFTSKRRLTTGGEPAETAVG